MKKRFIKFLVLTIAVFLSVLFIAPATTFADEATLVSISVTPEDSIIPALGQTQQFTATGTYSDDSTADITAMVTWESTDLSIATIDAAGLATGVGEGFTIITGSLDEVTNGTGLVVEVPYLWVAAGLPGETTTFGIWANNCSGLSWALVVEKDSTEIYSASGTIPLDEWDYHASYTLLEGDYTATLSVDGTVQRTEYFSVWEHNAWMDVSPGYAGEVTTITLNATYSSGRDAYFRLLRYVAEGDYWEIVDEFDTSINDDPWNYPITYTLSKGRYEADFMVNGRWEQWVEFSIVDRGVPQPPVEEKPVPERLEEHEPAINERPLSDYDKTNSGFTTLFYNRLLLRAPEQEGLDAWIAGLESGTVTGANLVNGFIFGEECQARISDYTSEEFITFLYKTLFSRAPEDNGFNAWLARMSAGITREELVDGFTHSEEFVNLCNTFGIIPYEGYISTTE